MKKIIALILAIACVLTLSVTAFAASPSAKPVIKVTLAGAGTIADRHDNTDSGTVSKDTAHKTVTVTVDEDGHVIAHADKEAGKFNGWKIYKAATTGTGKVALAVNSVAAISHTIATPDVDYIIVSGSLTSETIIIEPLTDLIITANYNDVVTDPATGKPADDKSPATGDMLLVYASVAMLAVFSVAFAAKKIKN